MRVFLDFRDLNKATPMDGYPMPVADLLVDVLLGIKLLASWMQCRVQSDFYGSGGCSKDSLQMSWTYRVI
jgi:hypothetical protein